MGFAALEGQMPGWWARRAFRRFVAGPEVERLAALVQQVRGGGSQAVLDALAAGLVAEHAAVLLQSCVRGLTAAEVERVVPALGADIGLRLLVHPAQCVVELKTERGDAVFRTLPAAVRREIEEVVPWQRTGERCPRCDGANLRHNKDTSTGREMRDVYCHDCRWLYYEDCGPSLASLLMAHARQTAAPAPVVQAERTGLVYVRLVVTDALGFYDDALGTYVAAPEPAHRNTHTWWFRVPGEWVSGGTLPPQRLTALYVHLYGEDWLYRRERSKYLVMAAEVEVLATRDEASRPWQSERTVHVWAEGTTFRSVPAGEVGS